MDPVECAAFLIGCRFIAELSIEDFGFVEELMVEAQNLFIFYKSKKGSHDEELHDYFSGLCWRKRNR